MKGILSASLSLAVIILPTLATLSNSNPAEAKSSKGTAVTNNGTILTNITTEPSASYYKEQQKEKEKVVTQTTTQPSASSNVSTQYSSQREVAAPYSSTVPESPATSTGPVPPTNITTEPSASYYKHLHKEKAVTSCAPCQSNVSTQTTTQPSASSNVSTQYSSQREVAAPYSSTIPESPATSTGPVPPYIEQTVSTSTTCTGLSCTSASGQGIPAAAIDYLTPLTVDRLEYKGPAKGGGQDVWATYATPLHPDEVLTINQNNQPVLMTPTGGGNLAPHPTRKVAFHKNELIIMDDAISLKDLQDDPFPTSTFAESDPLAPYKSTQEREVSNEIMATGYERPISPSDFSRPLPVNPSLAGIQPSEIGVSFNPSKAQAGRVVPVGPSLLILDDRGVIQGVAATP